MTLENVIEVADAKYAELEQGGLVLLDIHKGTSTDPNHLARFIIAEMVSAWDGAEGDSGQFQATVDGLKG